MKKIIVAVTLIGFTSLGADSVLIDRDTYKSPESYGSGDGTKAQERKQLRDGSGTGQQRGKSGTGNYGQSGNSTQGNRGGSGRGKH